MKNVLLLVHDDDGQEARLQAALDVIRAVAGHLSCLDVMIVPAIIAYDPYSGGAAVAELAAYERQRETANRTKLEARLANESVSWDWSETLDDPAAAIESAAGLADLIVLSRTVGKADPMEMRQIAGQVAGRSGAPVLAVANEARGINLAGTVLVAWDGSREADKALRAAVPLLRLAANVILIDVDDPGGAFAIDTAATYLSRHGIHAEAENAARKPGTKPFATILERARAANAAYIVMGAFGHSSVVEALFGGATHAMLENCELPLFLAH